MRRLRPVRPRRLASAIGGVLVLAGIPAATSAQEVSSSLVGYEATATGSAFTAFPRLPALLPVEAPIEATIGLATATLSSGGQGFGRASTFFPGTLTAGLRPLIETGAATRLPIPDYPIVVEAREFEEAKHASIPGVTMSTDVDPARAVSVADAGALGVPAVVGVRSMRTESRTVLEATSITATSTTTLEGLDLAGTVAIGSLVSVASVTSDGTSSTCSGGVTVEDVTVAGSRATLDDDGLHVDGKVLAPGVGAGTLVSQLFAASGIEVRTLGGISSCDGSLGSRTTSGLLISIPTPAIGPISPGGLQVVLGSTSATAGGSALPTDADVPAGVDPPVLGDVVSRLPGPFTGGGSLEPVAAPGARPGSPTGFPIDPVRYSFGGVPVGVLAGFLLLAFVGASRLRRYMVRIIGLVDP